MSTVPFLLFLLDPVIQYVQIFYELFKLNYISKLKPGALILKVVASN